MNSRRGAEAPGPTWTVSEPTSASTWQAVSGHPITDDLLEWPPDLFALANVLLARSEAFRFALAPSGQWPPSRIPDWARAVGAAGEQWGAWVEDRRSALPELLADEWHAFRERADQPLEQLALGEDRLMLESLLTLHAIADEACAGLGVALDTADGGACVYRARGRELLGTTGSLARLNPHLLRVLPKVRTPPTGRASFSRYACVLGPGIEARWNKMPTRHRGTDPRSEYATFLLLPWPLRVRESDFRTVDGSVQRLGNEPFGFFEFAPAEGLDLDLLDRVLVAARDEVRSVDVVLLPESAVDESELQDLETLLSRHGVSFLQTGVRQQMPPPGRLPGNWMHIGVNPSLQKGPPSELADGAPWFHIRQNKHHRWSLDEGQIYQYHLGGVLHPQLRWWESMDVPRRAVQFVEVAEVTLVALVCEDLAQNDEIAELIRSVGPTIVITALLDGPQLDSRWAARYASVFADDPGSAVLTLTSFGMVQRSRPLGYEASSVVALWKDPTRGIRQIPLEAGAHGVLLTACMQPATRRSSDGRSPVMTGTQGFDVAIHQIRAAGAASGVPISRSVSTLPRLLTVEELTILTGWAEAVAEAVDHVPERLAEVLAEARPGAPWRAELGLPEPSERLADAIAALENAVTDATPAGGVPTFDGLLAVASRKRDGEPALTALVCGALLSMLEERRTRHAGEAGALGADGPRARSDQVSAARSSAAA
jgi:hypothetical protein